MNITNLEIQPSPQSSQPESDATITDILEGGIRVAYKKIAVKKYGDTRMGSRVSGALSSRLPLRPVFQALNDGRHDGLFLERYDPETGLEVANSKIIVGVLDIRTDKLDLEPEFAVLPHSDQILELMKSHLDVEREGD